MGSVQILRAIAETRRRPAEYCWMTTCRAYDAAEKAGRTLGYDQLRHLTLSALDRCRVTGQLTVSQINVLVEHGVSGPPRADSAKRIVWDRALDTLDAEMNRMVFPAGPPPKAPHFFYGSNGSPFINAAEAWYWALDCLDARHEGSRAESAMKVGRPCDPDDVVNAMRRLDLSPIHARTVVAWGKKRIEPPEGTEPRRFWDQAMARLDAALREKGIVKTRHRAVDMELVDTVLEVFAPVSPGVPQIEMRRPTRERVAADNPALPPTNFKGMLNRRAELTVVGDEESTPEPASPVGQYDRTEGPRFARAAAE